MKYFYDTEFLEGTQKMGLFRRKETAPTIDLISIGIVAEDGREYYAVSKEFNLKEAWNRFDMESHSGGHLRSEPRKVYWIRENVLKPIFIHLNEADLRGQALCIEKYGYPIAHPLTEYQTSFSFRRLKELINKYGKTRKDISNDIIRYVNSEPVKTHGTNPVYLSEESKQDYMRGYLKPEFYGYYSAYDHVALCWLFGKMMDLPKGFPMYTIDLKQELDRRVQGYCEGRIPFEEGLKKYKDSDLYPKQENEHHALADARWNKKLYEFIQSF